MEDLPGKSKEVDAVVANISASMSNLSVSPACHSSLFDCAGPIVNSQIHDPIHHCIPMLCLWNHTP